ncbi:MAG: hypothetical protein J2P37_30540, partial [Ktedonobacteraceae bacterium]|nr:hypothetical protein [Ktedonobacteraceae bacterium]
ALAGDAVYAYKDGVPLQSPDGRGIYLGVTRHHIAGPLETAVHADTVLCQRHDAGTYEVTSLLLPRGAREDMDRTCNRLSCEMVFPDGTRFWGCDIRNVEEPYAALKTPLQPGDISQWTLGDFDEISACAIGRWEKGAPAPVVTSVAAILGRSAHSRYPTLRYLGLAPLISSAELAELAASPDVSSGKEHEVALVLTYERASATGSKSTYQQTIPYQELAQALSGRGPVLLVGQDPLAQKQGHTPALEKETPSR